MVNWKRNRPVRRRSTSKRVVLLVDATAMLQYNLKPGDSVKLGTITFPIIGSLITAPGSTGIGATAAPPIIVPFRFMKESGLLQKGKPFGIQLLF